VRDPRAAYPTAFRMTTYRLFALAEGLFRFALPFGVFAAALIGCKEATLGPEQFGSIQGSVLDFDTGLPIAGASVTTSPPTGALVTDGNGQFLIENAAAGNYTITASRAGYDANNVTVSVREGEVTQATVFLDVAEEDTTSDARFSAEVLSWANRRRGDSTFVFIEYRARNEGEVNIPAYEIYFRIDTTGPTFFEERQGTDLGPGQFDIANFEKFILTNDATAVSIDTFWFDGQEGATRPWPGMYGGAVLN